MTAPRGISAVLDSRRPRCSTSVARVAGFRQRASSMASSPSSADFDYFVRGEFVLGEAAGHSWACDAPMSLPISSAVTRCPVADLHQSW